MNFSKLPYQHFASEKAWFSALLDFTIFGTQGLKMRVGMPNQGFPHLRNNTLVAWDRSPGDRTRSRAIHSKKKITTSKIASLRGGKWGKKWKKIFWTKNCFSWKWDLISKIWQDKSRITLKRSSDWNFIKIFALTAPNFLFARSYQFLGFRLIFRLYQADTKKIGKIFIQKNFQKFFSKELTSLCPKLDF